ncbi:MAG: proton-conducting transporter membrane subunit, partial [Thaumarchaeota archaeon]|nr:proton-conducting transporter membrane subunit [Nitrososphaerota archaeon]
FALVFLFFTMANLGLPGTSSFVGEFMILLGVFQGNTFAARRASSGMVLGGAYSLWLYNRVAYGNLKTRSTGVSEDRELREVRVFIPFVVLTLVMGILPWIFLEPIHSSCMNLIESARFQ